MSQLFTGVFVRAGSLSGGLLSGRFCAGLLLSVPVLSKYICYNRKFNITLNCMLCKFDKTIYKCDVTCSLPPSPVTNCHIFSDPGPPPLERDVLYGPLIDPAGKVIDLLHADRVQS